MDINCNELIMRWCLGDVEDELNIKFLAQPKLMRASNRIPKYMGWLLPSSKTPQIESWLKIFISRSFAGPIKLYR